MEAANMVGDLPPELSALWALKYLDLRRNQLAGPLPAMDFNGMTRCYLIHGTFTDAVENKFTCPFADDVLGKCKSHNDGYSTMKSISNSMCVAVCSEGEYATDKQVCVACPGGKFTSSKVQIKCDVCPSSKYQLASSANQSSCPGAGATNCTGDKSTNVRPSATGGSENLPADQCNAWIKTYDDTGGPLWTQCADARTDPCSCKGSDSAYAYTCSIDGTTIERM